MFELFGEGLLTALQPYTLILMLIGTAVGIVFGAVPGLSTVMGLVLGLPFTYAMSPAVGDSAPENLGKYIPGRSECLGHYT